MIYYQRTDGSVYGSDGAAQQATDITLPYRPLSMYQKDKFEEIYTDYENAISVSVAYMSTTFQADQSSQDTLSKVITALTPSGSVPTGFYWVDAVNNQVPMTLAQLQGLAAAMMAQGWAAFQHLQALKAQVESATTVSAVQAIVW